MRNRGFGKPQVPRWLGPSPQDNLRAQTTHASPYQTAARNASRGPSAAGRKTSQRSTATDPAASGQNHSAGGPARTTTNERRQREWANHSARASEWANQLQSKRNPDARVGKALKNAKRAPPQTADTRDPGGSHGTTAAGEGKSASGQGKASARRERGTSGRRTPTLGQPGEPGRKSHSKAGNRSSTHQARTSENPHTAYRVASCPAKHSIIG